MKTKLVALAAAATALTTGLSGCGSDSSSSSDSKGGGTVASQMVFGAEPNFKTRPDGIPGLEKNYGVKFGKYTVTDVGGPVTVNALKRGQVDAVDLFTTDPSIAANNFVILEDPKSNFAAQNVVPLITKTKATDGVKQVITGIQAKLTTQNLGEMYAKVVNDKADPADVAKGFLSDNGLDASGTSAKGVSLTVGSANFPENVILADIYAQALEAQGATVETKLNIGARPKYWEALKQGSIDLFPEYTGSINSYLSPKSKATSPDDVYAALVKVLPSNLVALDKAEAQDSDAIVVTQETADKFKLKTIADLAKKG
ncbi:MAG: glycine betaine ABC transporter substrate-binding protein [Marmoricola sp.]